MSIKIEGHPSLVKQGGVIVNTNTDEFLAFINKRKLALEKDSKISELQDQVNKLETLVRQLLEREQNDGK